MRKLVAAAAMLAVAAFFGVSGALAQDAGKDKDDALDKILEKLDEPQTKPGADDPAKPKDEVDPKDKELDSLLEKLGETKEEVAPEKPGAAAGPGDTPPAPRPEGQKPEALEGKAKDLDEHLEELTGRKRNDKKRPQQRPQDGQGPLTEVIKKMEDVERRLSKTDTGEQTRKTQGEIVKQLDKIMEQIRQASSQGGRGQRMSRQVRQAGNQGNQPGQNNPSNTGAGVGPMKPLTPDPRSSLARDKNIWGDLPPQLRQVMNNVFKEEPLTSKSDLISRYFLTLSKKSQARGD